MRLYIQDIPQSDLETAMIRPPNSYWEENLNRFEKGSSHWTKILRTNDNAMNKIKEQQLKWDNFLPVNHNYDYWKAQFTMVNKIKFDNRIMVNQLLITKNNMKTNIIVSKFRPITENCSYCARTRESVFHLFSDCTIICNFYNAINLQLPIWTAGKPIADYKDKLFMKTEGKLDEREVLKLMTRSFIWSLRCMRLTQNLNVENFKEYAKKLLAPHVKAKTLDFLLNRAIRTEIGLPP